MNKSKIEWCTYTWSPVTGCLHGCEYCYARKIADRFGCKTKHGEVFIQEKPFRYEDNDCETGEIIRGPIIPYPFGFEPTFHRYRLDEPSLKTKPQTIFVCSMADLFGDWVPDEWIEAVFNACENAPQHRYLFLTKNPKRYQKLYEQKAFPYLNNFWFGSTITKPSDEYHWFEKTPYHQFVSIEPLLEPFGMINGEHFPEWVIIGAETGNRKDKVVPKAEWITEITAECDRQKIPVFMKNSLVPIVGEANMRREFPW